MANEYIFTLLSFFFLQNYSFHLEFRVRLLGVKITLEQHCYFIFKQRLFTPENCFFWGLGKTHPLIKYHVYTSISDMA